MLVKLSQIFHNRMIVEATSCVGLAGLSNVNNDPKMMVYARLKYASALRLTIAALQDLKNVELNVAIMSVMMLAMFEVRMPISRPYEKRRPELIFRKMITCDPRTMTSWANHIDGAAALVNVRQRKEKKYVRMFINLLFSIVCPAICPREFDIMLKNY